MKILLIGCGRMGGAMLSGWLEGGVPSDDVLIVDPIAKIAGVKTVKSVDEATDFNPDYVIVAIKPQMIDAEFVKTLDNFPGAVVISVAAGVKCKTFNNDKTLRAMPNIPALVGKGITGLFPDWQVSEKETIDIERLFSPLGKYLWVDSEYFIDSVTAISGSGPAYIFLFLESLAQAGVELNLTREQSEKLAYETMIGALETYKKSDESLIDLMNKVTSPGGTTEAALNVFKENDAMLNLVKKATKAAFDRSEELSS